MTTTASISTTVKFRPISPQLGAVVENVDAKQPLSAVQVEELKNLLMRFKVIFLPDQDLNYDEHERFASQFGELRYDPLEHAVPGHPGLALIDNVPWFHADWMHQENPPLWSMLQMNSVPEVGGDTMFADLVASYEALSKPLRDFLETLTVYQCMSRFEGDGSALAASYVEALESRFSDVDAAVNFESDKSMFDFDLALERVQPRNKALVRYIPETGRKNYWVSRTFTQKINELTPAESETLLEFLYRHQLEPQFVIRWKWHPGDIAFWDHRTTLHSGIKDYENFVRFGCRASLAGGRLIPASEAPSE